MSHSRLEFSNELQNFGGLNNLIHSVNFWFNDRKLEGFRGDSVFAAAISNGVTIGGTHDDEPLGIDYETAPLVWMLQEGTFSLVNAQVQKISSSARFYSYFPEHPHPPKTGFWTRLVRRLTSRGAFQTFSMDFSSIESPFTPPSEYFPQLEKSIDVVVVGGGIAGMRAALHHAQSGRSVILCERTGQLGGLAPLFGREIDGEKPQTLVDQLAQDIAAHPDIEVWLNCSVIRLSVGKVESTRTLLDEFASMTSVRIAAKHIVMATGQKNLLPHFQGNRAPATLSAATAYYLARDYAVAPGKVFAAYVCENVGYNLALSLAKAGAVAKTIIDPRTAPTSKFIDFLKAYGVTNMAATRVKGVEAANGKLKVTVGSSQVGQLADREIEVDGLVLSGGWQPDLDLWVEAGGAVRWDKDQSMLLPHGSMPDIELAGSICAAEPDANAYESPREYLPPLIDEDDSNPSLFLNGGRSFDRYENSGDAGHSLLDLFQNKAPAQLSRIHQSVLDLAALVELGEIPEDAIAPLVDEKCFSTQISGRKFENLFAHTAAVQLHEPLNFRFGPDSQILRISSNEAGLVRGALLFETGAPPSASDAIGVVIEQLDDGWTALVKSGFVQSSNCAAMVSGRRISCTLAKSPATDSNALDQQD